jgi:predicted PurR-regulated permease PerM
MNDRNGPPPPAPAVARPRPGVSQTEFAHRTLVVAGIVTLFVAGAAAFARASDVFFLFFAGVLLAILLRTVADAVTRYTGIGPKWGLGLVVFVLLGLVGTGAYFAGSMVVSQVNQLARDLPNSLDQARDQLRQYPWGRELLEHAPSARSLATGGTGNVTSSVTAFFSTTFGFLGNLIVLVALTLYLAATPRKYLDGLVRLVPPPRRGRAEQVLNAVGFHLKWWLIGRAVAMVVVTVVTGVGLAAMGVEQYLVLALLSGLLTSIPFFGPIIAAVPAILIALAHDPMTALWVAGVYWLAQAVENYLVTPLVQQRFVHLPPILTIMAVVLVGGLFGVLGLIVATPLALMILVLVKTLYVKDCLGDHLEVPGEERTPRDGRTVTV